MSRLRHFTGVVARSWYEQLRTLSCSVFSWGVGIRVVPTISHMERNKEKRGKATAMRGVMMNAPLSWWKRRAAEIYRRRDHLICSLADCNTWRRGGGGETLFKFTAQENPSRLFKDKTLLQYNHVVAVQCIKACSFRYCSQNGGYDISAIFHWFPFFFFFLHTTLFIQNGIHFYSTIAQHSDLNYNYSCGNKCHFVCLFLRLTVQSGGSCNHLCHFRT